ncbi:YopX family protein [Bacillus sp. FSL W8-1122]
MREIKFRAWDNGKMQKVDFNNLFVNRHHPTGTLYLRKEMPFGDYHITELMQYTGLKDKNGTEIYEGDVVATEYSDRKFLVFYDIGRGGFSPFAMDDGCGCCSDELISIPEDCEVIGNKFEHPDLLNK